MRNLFQYILLLVFLFFSTQCYSQKQGSVICLSDIHFDPYLGLKDEQVQNLSRTPAKDWKRILENSPKQFSGYSDDCNYWLLKSALQNMKDSCADAKYMIISGDFLRHGFIKAAKNRSVDQTDSFIKHTYEFLTGMLKEYLPNMVIIPALGNNDSYAGNYYNNTTDGFLDEMQKQWFPLQHNKNILAGDAQMNTFNNGGYYAFRTKEDSSHTIIVLNTVLFSKKRNIESARMAYEELNWLDKTLEACKEQKVWLVYHIPPGKDSYWALTENKDVMMWDESTQARFYNIIGKYTDIITAQIAGHTHVDDNRVMYKNNEPVSFVHITPPLSAIYCANPAYQKIYYNRADYTLSDLKTYYLNVSDKKSKWSLEYRFSDAYKTNSITPASLDKILKNSLADIKNKKATPYQKYYGVNRGIYSSLCLTELKNVDWQLLLRNAMIDLK